MALGPGDLTWLSGHLVPPILLPPGNLQPPPRLPLQQVLLFGRCSKPQQLDRGERRQSAQEAGRVGKGDTSEAHTLLADGSHFILFSHEFYKVLWQQQESLPMLALSGVAWHLNG